MTEIVARAATIVYGLGVFAFRFWILCTCKLVLVICKLLLDTAILVRQYSQSQKKGGLLVAKLYKKVLTYQFRMNERPGF